MAAREVLNLHNAAVRETLSTCSGYECKEFNGSFMTTFAQPTGASSRRLAQRCTARAFCCFTQPGGPTVPLPSALPYVRFNTVVVATTWYHTARLVYDAPGEIL